MLVHFGPRDEHCCVCNSIVGENCLHRFSTSTYLENCHCFLFYIRTPINDAKKG